MRIGLVVLVVLAACHKDQPPKNAFEAFERKFVAQYELLAKAMRAQGKPVSDKEIPTSYRAVYVGTPGVFVDRKLVATLPEIQAKHAALVAAIEDNDRLVPTIGFSGPVATFDLERESAATAISALQLFAQHTTMFMLRYEDPEVPQMASHILCSELKIRATPNANRDQVQASVFLDKGRTWLGLSKVDEFQEIVDTAGGLDLEKLKASLRETKQSERFSDRTDLELAAAAGTAADVLEALRTACNEGFTDIAVLAPDQLSARPRL